MTLTIDKKVYVRMELQSIIKKFKEQKILVIGDVILDRYLFGEALRLSTEAPVPILQISDKDERLGGASNTANNIKSLGGEAELISSIGDDARGRSLLRILRERGIRTNKIIKDNRSTSTKTRVIARLKNHTPQQIVRYDEEKNVLINSKTEQKIMAFIKDSMTRHKVIIISDYNKGLMTEKIINTIKENSTGKTVIVDTKPTRFGLYKDLDWFTPNTSEIESYTETKDDIILTAQKFMKTINPSHLLVTAGDKGMYLFNTNKDYDHIPALVRNAVDVSGAGDTVVATLALCLSTGANPLLSSTISNAAASVVVQKMGTSTVTTEELIKSLTEE
jgi:rfaE bifunctional protein kinase chain/domain